MRSTQVRDAYPTQDNNTCGSIADFLVLCPGKLDHALGGRVGDLDFSEDGISVVGENNSSHGIQQHLQHGAGSKTRPDNIGNSLEGKQVTR